MLKKHSQFFARLMMVLDVLVVIAGAIAAYVLVNQADLLYPPVYYLWLLPIFAFIWSCLLIYLGMYDSFRIKPVHQVLGIICVAAFVGFIILEIFLIFAS